MGLFDFGTQKVSTTVKRRVIVAATPLGKQKMQNFEGEGIKFDVLATVVDQGPCTVQEVAAECKISIEKAKYVIKDLIADGFIRIMNANEPMQPVQS